MPTKKYIDIKKPKLDRGFLNPDYKSSVRRLLIIIGKAYLRIVEGISCIEAIHKDIIIEALKKFYSGDERLIFVFRHVAKEDPPLLSTFFLHTIRRIIKKEGYTSHVTFLYGRDVPNWAGKITEWLFPRIGAIPVQTHSGNKNALTLLRSETIKGRFPLILAPEGQVVYHMYKSFSIAPGISSLVKWGLESKKTIRIIPLSIGYKYSKKPDVFIRQKLVEWEKQTGIKLQKNIETEELFPLLRLATQETLNLLEPLCKIKPQKSDILQSCKELDNRIKNLCEALLDEAEKEAQIEVKNSDYKPGLTERLFKIRYRGFDAFFPKEDPTRLPPLPSALADFEAIKATVYTRYERIVDVLEYIHLSYIEPPFSAGRGCEYILNLLDLINRAKGGSIDQHISPKRKKAVIFSGNPLLYKPEEIGNYSRKEFIKKVKDDVSLALEDASTKLETICETEKLK